MPSKLFYIIGSSGAGKDSIMSYARKKLISGDKVLFAHRYITRPATDPTENHICLSPEEFKIRLDADLFSLNWESHGLFYGVGKEINLWLEKGFNVIVNGSREYLSNAKEKYPNLNPILIEVDPEILRDRLKKRGRESSEEIENRLIRNQNLRPNSIPCTSLWNNGTLEESGNAFFDLIRT